MAMTVRENVILMFVMAIIIVGVAWVRGLESGTVKSVEGFLVGGRRGGRARGHGGNRQRGSGWFGGGDGWRGFLPYWLLSRSVGSAISPSTVNVTQDDPYLTGVSRVTATLRMLLMVGFVLTGVYLAYKWLVVKRH